MLKEKSPFTISKARNRTLTTEKEGSSVLSSRSVIQGGDLSKFLSNEQLQHSLGSKGFKEKKVLVMTSHVSIRNACSQGEIVQEVIFRYDNKSSL